MAGRAPGRGVQRRTVLGLLGIAATAGAGCVGRVREPSGPRLPPRPEEDGPQPGDAPDPLRIDKLDFEETDDGRLRIFGTIENRSEADRTATVSVTVTVDDEEFNRATDVPVPAGEIEPFEIVFDLEYGRFVEGGEFSATVA